ncbi:MAG: hypothetical protein IJB27_06830 [Clostridia bacterium]|nr:hypothetical protein [Clostridia bacterium]
MRVAVIGSREVNEDIDERIRSHLPPSTSQIISGGAKGVDQAAKRVAAELGIPFLELLPDYQTYGKRAPLVRNDAIIEKADMVLAIWDGESHGTQYVIGECLKRSKRVVYLPLKGE